MGSLCGRRAPAHAERQASQGAFNGTSERQSLKKTTGGSGEKVHIKSDCANEERKLLENRDSGSGGTAFEKAEQAKDMGNAWFKENNYFRALAAYSQAIDFIEDLDDDVDDGELDRLEPSAKSCQCPNIHVYYTNRAFCHIKMENYGSALADATKAIEIKQDFPKAFYRRGTAYMALGQTKLAFQDFKELCKLVPNERDARDKLKQCQRDLQQEKFLQAIASPQTAPLSKTLDMSSMKIDGSYDGPVYRKKEHSADFCKQLMEFQRQQKNIPIKCAYEIVLDTIELLKKASTLVDVTVPDDSRITVCGDVHGQYYDLLNIWEMNGVPSDRNPYLFNGDFVDRGSFSVEVILILFAWKLLFPDHLHLARGNHETRNMNKLYGFEGEVTSKYDARLYQLFCEAFCYLPLCHVINRQAFVVHGGLFSQDGIKLDAIRSVDRVAEPPDAGLFVEMLWSDPHPGKGRTPSKRGVGVAFGSDVTEDFLKTNGLKLVIRSHEMKENGYEKEHGGKCITVFSAPNYCDQMGNKGAFIHLDGKTMTPKYTTFAAVPHPPVRPMQYANPMLGSMMGM
jgi:serine/threonine-protein phosphatase 5